MIDLLNKTVRSRHIGRLTHAEATIEMGFVLSDILSNLERVSDHCSNIAGCILEMAHDGMDIHEYLNRVKGGAITEFNDYYDYFKMKYSV